MSFEEDLSPFIDTAGGFAQTGSIAGQPVAGIYNSGFDVALDVQTETPSFTCKSADIPAGADEGTPVILSEGTFTIKEIQPNAGISTILLHSK